jgi:hypothetical protein
VIDIGRAVYVMFRICTGAERKPLPAAEKIVRVLRLTTEDAETAWSRVGECEIFDCPVDECG